MTQLVIPSASVDAGEGRMPDVSRLINLVTLSKQYLSKALIAATEPPAENLRIHWFRCDRPSKIGGYILQRRLFATIADCEQAGTFGLASGGE